jgi:hypothetical protein
VASEQVNLQSRNLSGTDRNVAKFPEACVDAVDWAILLRNLLDET